MKSKVLQRKMFRDPSEDENVGIMQGFMDSLEEMLTGEGDMSEEEDSPSGAPDRTPRSPEILMNTMRGDMRSVDARVEELADMVGYNAASSTPLEVLALLQPVLKQQGIAALPTSSAMPPSPVMAPPPSTSVPPVPTQGGGIATLPQGDMAQGQPPMDMPMQMARGGVVQNFAEGDEVDAENVTRADTGTFSPEMMAFFNKRLLSLQEDADTVPSQLAPGYLMQRTQELAPQYRTLIGADPSASKGQMLFDVAQAALNYAGNVNAQGQQMRGSQAARLAGAFSGLPAAIGARAAEAQKQNQAIRMAAMQGAQSEIDAARSASISQRDTLDKLAIEAMKNSGSTPRPLSAQDKVDYGITGADANLPWVFNSTGVPVVTGGRPPASLINLGGGPTATTDVMIMNNLNESLAVGNTALETKATVNDINSILDESLAEGTDVFVGPVGKPLQYVNRLITSLSPEEESATDSKTAVTRTATLLRNLASLELQAAKSMRGQGAITENERTLIRLSSAGTQLNTTAEIRALTNAIDKVADYRIALHNDLYNRAANIYTNDPNMAGRLTFFQLGNRAVLPPTGSSEAAALPTIPTISAEAIAAEIVRRNALGQ